MNKLLSTVIALLITSTLLRAQDQQRDLTQQREDDRQKVEIRDLPQPVRTALESTEYAGWTVSSAYRTTQTEAVDETQSMEVYVVELKSGAETRLVRFDRDGNRIDEHRHDE